MRPGDGRNPETSPVPVLPAGAVLVEYYSAGDRMVAAIISREGIEIVPLSALQEHSVDIPASPHGLEE